ncbi:hypothetical protein ABK040_014964 [Willaertia magna]
MSDEEYEKFITTNETEETCRSQISLFRVIINIFLFLKVFIFNYKEDIVYVELKEVIEQILKYHIIWTTKQINKSVKRKNNLINEDKYFTGIKIFKLNLDSSNNKTTFNISCLNLKCFGNNQSRKTVFTLAIWKGGEEMFKKIAYIYKESIENIKLNGIEINGIVFKIDFILTTDLLFLMKISNLTFKEMCPYCKTHSTICDHKHLIRSKQCNILLKNLHIFRNNIPNIYCTIFRKFRKVLRILELEEIDDTNYKNLINYLKELKIIYLKLYNDEHNKSWYMHILLHHVVDIIKIYGNLKCYETQKFESAHIEELERMEKTQLMQLLFKLLFTNNANYLDTDTFTFNIIDGLNIATIKFTIYNNKPVVKPSAETFHRKQAKDVVTRNSITLTDSDKEDTFSLVKNNYKIWKSNNLRVVRATSLQFIILIMKEFPSLYWSTRCLFSLLEILSALYQVIYMFSKESIEIAIFCWDCIAVARNDEYIIPLMTEISNAWKYTIKKRLGLFTGIEEEEIELATSSAPTVTENLLLNASEDIQLLSKSHITLDTKFHLLSLALQIYRIIIDNSYRFSYTGSTSNVNSLSNHLVQEDIKVLQDIKKRLEREQKELNRYQPVATTDIFTYKIINGQTTSELYTISIHIGNTATIQQTAVFTVQVTNSIPVIKTITKTIKHTKALNYALTIVDSNDSSIVLTDVDSSLLTIFSIGIPVKEGSILIDKTLNIYITNAAPVANSDTVTKLWRETSFTISLLYNDVDSNSDSIIITSVSSSKSILTISQDKKTIAYNYGETKDVFSEIITYTIIDVVVTDLLSKYIDSNYDSLIFQGVDSASKGTVTVTNAQLDDTSYTPSTLIAYTSKPLNGIWSITDSFNYKCSDSLVTSTETVSVTITNTPPTCVNKTKIVTRDYNNPNVQITSTELLIGTTNTNSDSLSVSNIA